MAIAMPPQGNKNIKKADRYPLDEEDMYPSSDGKPMGETDKHLWEMLELLYMLRGRFAEEADTYVAGNNFLYYQQDDPKKVVSPDAYVVFDIPNHMRDTYMAWKEGGKLPAVVFEITSKKTKRVDIHTKRPLYQNVLRIPEYFMFDPIGDYLRPNRLQGFRLENDIYVPIPLVAGRLHSEQLNLDLAQEGDTLRLYDCRTGTRLLKMQETRLLAEEQQRRAEEQQRYAEEQQRYAEEQQRRAEQAEAELARLRVAFEALRNPRAE